MYKRRCIKEEEEAKRIVDCHGERPSLGRSFLDPEPFWSKVRIERNNLGKMAFICVKPMIRSLVCGCW